MPEPTNVHQLPRGRHRLTREEVRSSQRGRMLEALGTAVGENGYAKTPVAEIIKRAGVSRETFYEHFADKEECFLAALDTGVEALLGTMAAALGEPADDPVQRFDRALRAYLDALASEPAFARAALVEVYAVGPRAIARRMEMQQRFVDAVVNVFGVRRAADRFACEALVAAISSMVVARLAEGREDELRKLRRPITDLVRRYGLDATHSATAS